MISDRIYCYIIVPLVTCRYILCVLQRWSPDISNAVKPTVRKRTAELLHYILIRIGADEMVNTPAVPCTQFIHTLYIKKCEQL